MTEEFVEVKFLDWMAHPPEDHPVLLLHCEETNRILPIWVSLPVASEFAARDQGFTQNRPGMHEVLADAMDLVDKRPLRGQISAVHEGVFIAALVFEGEVSLDMRPSDVIVMAEMLEVPLYVADEVMDAVSVPAHQMIANGYTLDDDVNDEMEESVEKFAEFLDSIDADYFASGDEGDSDSEQSDESR